MVETSSNFTPHFILPFNNLPYKNIINIQSHKMVSIDNFFELLKLQIVNT